jgi:hypothetical protein
MVDLPRHVRGRPNPSGRMYFSFEKFRGTDRAWPVVPILDSPQDDAFWRRAKQCESLNAERAGDGWAWSWLAESGRSYPLPQPRGDEGPAAFWAAIDAAEARDRQDDGKERKTFDALITAYKAHPAPERLADAEGELPAPVDPRSLASKIPERIWRKVLVGDNCWEWQGAKAN